MGTRKKIHLFSELPSDRRTRQKKTNTGTCLPIFSLELHRLVQLSGWVGRGAEGGQANSLHFRYGSTIWRDTAEKHHSWLLAGQSTHTHNTLQRHKLLYQKYFVYSKSGVYLHQKKFFYVTPLWRLYNNVNIAGQLPAPSRSRSLHRTCTLRNTESVFI